MTSESTIVWTRDLNTGIEVLDNQHRRIVNYINQLGASIQMRNHAAAAEVLNELVDYTTSHFAFEESLQIETGYQFAKPHKAVHDAFIQRLAKLQEKHDCGEDVAAPLHTMLNSWLIHHIKHDDMSFVKDVSASIHRVVGNRKEENWLSRAIGRFFR